jgi:hypothetical protein
MNPFYIFYFWGILFQEGSHQTAVSAPLLISFCAKMKKTVLTKNPLANDVKKHIGLIFSPAGETLILFSDIQTVIPLKGFLRFATKCDIACDKMRQNAILHATNAISHFVAFCCILSHAISQHTDVS